MEQLNTVREEIVEALRKQIKKLLTTEFILDI